MEREFWIVEESVLELGVLWKEAGLHAVGGGRDLEAGKKEKEKERVASHSISSAVDFSGGTNHSMNH